MFNYLIRVKLPDRPGALGAVASRIGSVGGDVVSIDILQRGRGSVVDELGVGLDSDTLLDLLRDEVLEVDGVSIESIRAVEGPMPDRDTELLEMAAELFKGTPPPALLEHLTARVRRCLAATFAAVADEHDSEIVTSDGEPPEDIGSGSAHGAGEGSADGSALGELDDRPGLVVTPMPLGGKILIVGRLDPVLRQRERQWISTMAGLADYGYRGAG